MAVADDDTGRAAGLWCYTSKQARPWKAFSKKAMVRSRVEIPELQFEDW